MNKLITERTFQSTVWRLAERSAAVKAAVSYCGQEAVAFFPDRNRPVDIRIIVDMSAVAVQRGLTNPAGVSRLCQIGAVRSFAGLHSKVVVFDHTDAVVGSTNFSRSSIDSQRQCCVHTNDRQFVKQATLWFDELWSESDQVSQAQCKKMAHMFPVNDGHGTRESGAPKGQFKMWRKMPQEYTLEPGDFTINLTKTELRRAVDLFRKTQCGYRDPDKEKVTCAQLARRSDKGDSVRSRRFSALLRRIDSWGGSDLELLFNLAYTNGRAAQIGKPRFLRHPINKIRKAMRYLFLTKTGDPLVRFEHVVSGKYKLPGMSYSGIAFLMHLWKPDQYAIWNGSVDKGLVVLKVSFNRQFSPCKAQGYADRIAALRAVMKKAGLKTFNQVDHFVDAFAKKHLEMHNVRGVAVSSDCG